MNGRMDGWMGRWADGWSGVAGSMNEMDRWHAPRICMELTVSLLLLTVNAIFLKTSTELNGGRWISSETSIRVFPSRWHAPRIFVELTVSLLLFTVSTVLKESP